jgi:hypothetical protein
VKGRMRSKHATTEAEIITRYEQRCEFEDGLLVRVRMTFGPLGANPSESADVAQGRAR